MGLTTHHLPYPDPADPVNKGAAAIKSLADTIDACYRSGAVIINTAKVKTGSLTAVQSFGSPFPIDVTILLMFTGAGGFDSADVTVGVAFEGSASLINQHQTYTVLAAAGQFAGLTQHGILTLPAGQTAGVRLNATATGGSGTGAYYRGMFRWHVTPT